MSKVTLQLEGEARLIAMRGFAAPPELLYRAYSDPHLIQKWLLGPTGWKVRVRLEEIKVGGKFRYEYTNNKGQSVYLTGEYLQVEPNRRIVHMERMQPPAPTFDNYVETTFAPNQDGTLLVIRTTFPNDRLRADLLATDVENGLEESYLLLDRLIEKIQAAGSDLKTVPD